METMNVTCRLDAKDVVFLDQLAGIIMDRDRSYLIKKAVADFIEMQKWQVEQVKLARAEIKAGKGLTMRELKADMKTWDE